MTASPVILPADDGHAPRLVYITSPRSTHRTPRYRTMLGHIAARFPAATLLQARYLSPSRSTAEWERRWPSTLAKIDALCVFPDEDGWVGFEVWRQVDEAAGLWLPVWMVSDDGRFYRRDEVMSLKLGSNIWRRYVRLVFPGERVVIEHA